MLRFERGQADAEALQEVIDATLAELADESTDAAETARAAGLDPAELRDVSAEAEEDAQGADPILTAIVVSVAGGLAKEVVVRLWDNVIWPRVRRRLGERAVGDRLDP